MRTQLVWDMDGTLLDSRAAVPDAFIAAVEELGGPQVDRNEVVAAYSLGVPEAMLEHLLHRTLEMGEVDAYYRRLLHAPVEAYAGIADTLSLLRSLDHRIVVFTGASSRAARTLLAAAEIDVDLLIGGDQIASPKPAPDGLLSAAGRLQLSPGDLVYIGDAPTDLQAAGAAGARSAAASWGHLYDVDAPADVVLSAPGAALGLLTD